MPFLPIAERELRVAARRRATYYVRWWAVLIAAIIFAWQLVSISGGSSARRFSAQGHDLFATLLVICYVYSVFIGANTTSDSLSREKREGTFGLLFLTDLKAYDIIVGKIIGSSLSAAYSLVAIVPMLAIPILLGGVSVTEFVHGAAASVTALFLSLATGMLASACNHNERKATFYTIILILVIFGAPLVAAFGLETFLNVPAAFVERVASASPMVQCVDVLSRGRVLGGRFWFHIAVIWTVTLLFGFASAQRMRRDLNGSEAGERQKRVGPKWRRWASGYRHFLDENPFLWLSLRPVVKKYYAFAFVAVMLTIWTVGFIAYGDALLDGAAGVAFGLLTNTFLKIWIITEACQQLIEARRSGALELLLSTPLTVADVIRGQWMALRRQFGWAVAVMAVLEFGFIMNCHGHAFYYGWWLMLPFDCLALGWVGMWLGLTAKDTTSAIVKGTLLILSTSWILFFGVGAFFIGIGDLMDRVFDPRERSDIGLLWFLVATLITWSAGWLWAKPRLFARFRLIASEQYQLKKSGK